MFKPGAAKRRRLAAADAGAPETPPQVARRLLENIRHWMYLPAWVDFCELQEITVEYNTFRETLLFVCETLVEHKSSSREAPSDGPPKRTWHQGMCPADSCPECWAAYGIYTYVHTTPEGEYVCENCALVIPGIQYALDYCQHRERVLCVGTLHETPRDEGMKRMMHSAVENCVTLTNDSLASMAKLYEAFKSSFVNRNKGTGRGWTDDVKHHSAVVVGALVALVVQADFDPLERLL